ncbi:MAG: hypothetical protein GY804_00600 [Alphaproteobacteria bacterium]|nr:hypothetical protein [Alphaproteobacteria bacterium]
MKELVISTELAGLDKTKAEQIEAVFAPMVNGLKSFEKAFDVVVSQEITKETCKTAKRLRLDIAKIRVSADKTRKIQKEEYIRGGNAVQGVYNILKFAVADKEEKLKEIETHFERLEEEKKKTLQAERELKLTAYDFDGSAVNLGAMTDDVWTNFLSGTKLNYEAVKEAEQKAEADRLAKIEADRVEQERIRKENEALKKEREAAEKKRIALEKENDDRLAKERAEAERKAEIERKKVEAEKAKQEAILKKEREAAEKIRKELAEKEAKEKAEKEAKAEAEKKALEAGDSEKLETLLSNFDLLRGGKLKSEVAQTAIKQAYAIITDAIKKIKD